MQKLKKAHAVLPLISGVFWFQFWHTANEPLGYEFRASDMNIDYENIKIAL